MIELVVNVGVLAQRTEAAASSDGERLRARLEETLAAILAAAEDVCRAQAGLLSPKPRLRLWSAMQGDLDRVAAEVALARGMGLAAVLPPSAAEGRARASLAQAESVLELWPDGAGAHGNEAALAARLLVDQSDVLLTDHGREPAPCGPEALAIEGAVAGEVPVVVLPQHAAQACEVVWRRWMPLPHPHHDFRSAPSRAGSAALADAVRGQLAPPSAGVAQIGAFLHEPLDEGPRRLEYALLVRLLSGRGAPGGGPAAPPRDDLLAPYERRAELLGGKYGSSHRSHFVSRFGFLAVLSVALGLVSILEPSWQSAFAAIQALTTALILVDSHLAAARRWQERWLEYRYLREQLRTLRFLRRVGASVPHLHATGAPDSRGTWMDWLGTRLARAAGVESGRLDRARVRELAARLASEDIDGQLAYHGRSSAVLRTVARRLRKGARGILVGVLAFSLVRLVIALAGVAVPAAADVAFTAVMFLLPPIAAAAEGIASRGDFDRLAERSESTRASLAAVGEALRSPDLDFERLFALSWHAAAAMISDVAQWRFVSEARRD